MLVKRNIFFRFVALLLMLLILIMPVFIPAAQAVVVESAVLYGAYELIAAMLIGGGVVYATSDDARSAAAQVYDWLASNASAVLDKINFWVAQAIVGGVSTGIRVSQDIWDMISSAFNDLFSSDSIEFGREYVVTDQDQVRALADSLQSVNVKTLKWVRTDGQEFTFSLVLKPDGKDTHFELYRNGELYGEDQSYWGKVSDFRFSFSYVGSRDCIVVSSYALTSSDWHFLSYMRQFFTAEGTYTFSGDSVAPDLVFPSDNSLVRVPDLPDVQTDDEGKEVVVYPDLSLNPTDHLADIPKQETGEQVDVPYDTLVDVGTGEAVGEGEGTGEGDITDPADPAGTLPKPGDLSLPQLIISKFPFCIPFDVANLIGQLNASAEAPVIRIPVKTIDGIATQYITIDFSQYESLVSIVRWGIYILFVAGLAYATRNYIKW